MSLKAEGRGRQIIFWAGLPPEMSPSLELRNPLPDVPVPQVRRESGGQQDSLSSPCQAPEATCYFPSSRARNTCSTFSCKLRTDILQSEYCMKAMKVCKYTI